MASKMLIDAAHPEETRVCVVRGNRIEEFDYESSSRRPLKGNIYLAKVTRVEPSLQAAFVEYGGNRHGFLAFSEIHPDYYQIPVADRQALLEAEAEDARMAREEEDDEGEKKKKPRRRLSRAAKAKDDKVTSDEVTSDEATSGNEDDDEAVDEAEANGENTSSETDNDDHEEVEAIASDDADNDDDSNDEGDNDDDSDDDDNVDVVADNDDADVASDAPAPRKRAPRKSYKIQEVIKRRQVLLIQVVKEERGNKGAALTTYMSLAGRYCVLMPNTARGGGISRKITDASDRRRLKDVIKEVEVPAGMGLIVRTAGAQRTKTEIRRDYDYLLRMWESVRELTLKSAAPTLVYEEGNLIKRSIRDLYSKDIEEVIVEGEEGYREAKDFMKMLMPSHSRNVKLYKDTRQLFTRHQIESQLDGLFTPNVTLPSGGYIVMNQTEALVSIDINSGKATREHNIEDTALKTNLEAAVEISRQLRLRDLAGLIVIDFIDMDENRNNRAVERKLKDALKNDRARIQVGRISHFGLLEMSRQRLRQGMMESSTMQCPHCEGTGVIRGVSSCALSVLRGIEENLLSRKPESMDVRVHPEVAFYIFNDKREHLLSLEANYGISIYIMPDAERPFAESIIERKPERKGPTPRLVASATAVAMGDGMEANDDEPFIEDQDDTDGDEVASNDNQRNEEVQLDENGEPRKKRRRRRGRRGGRRQREERDEDGNIIAAEGEAASKTDGDSSDEQADGSAEPSADVSSEAGEDGEDKPKKRRRRSRGGRSRSQNAAAENGDEAVAGDAPAAVEVELEVSTENESSAEPDAVAEAEEKPKPRKRAPRKSAKKAAAEASADASADAVPAAAEASADEAPVADDEKPAKKPRKRAAKKAKPEEADAEAALAAFETKSAEPEPAMSEPAPARWQPPAPTVDPATAPKKAGWWGKR
jgi:ribonuclease E